MSAAEDRDDVPDVLTTALAYAARGWMIFPVPPGMKQSYKSIKEYGRNWGMTKDPVQITADYTRWPNAGVGIPTGTDNGFFVVEADTLAGHPNGADGLAALKRLQDQHGAFPDTLRAMSPSGSPHFYFQYPTDGTLIDNSANGLPPGIDVRGHGGMVVAPPTIRHGVGVYRWLNEGTPIAEAPAWLLQLLKKPPLAAARHPWRW